MNVKMDMFICLEDAIKKIYARVKLLMEFVSMIQQTTKKTKLIQMIRKVKMMTLTMSVEV